MTTIMVPVIVCVQVGCLIVGIIQGWRFRRTEPFTKSLPWLGPVILGGTVVLALQAL